MYTDIVINGNLFDLTHLNPHNIIVTVDGTPFTATIKYGDHCFTDEKDNGPLLYTRTKKDNSIEYRYWSFDRYQDSLNLPKLITRLFQDHSTYVIPFKTKNTKGEQYHYLEYGCYAIFFYINNIDVTHKKFTIYVVSAYDKTEYNGCLPKKGPKKLSWVLKRRIDGFFVL